METAESVNSSIHGREATRTAQTISYVKLACHQHQNSGVVLPLKAVGGRLTWRSSDDRLCRRSFGIFV